MNLVVHNLKILRQRPRDRCCPPKRASLRSLPGLHADRSLARLCTIRVDRLILV